MARPRSLPLLINYMANLIKPKIWGTVAMDYGMEGSSAQPQLTAIGRTKTAIQQFATPSKTQIALLSPTDFS